MKFQFKKEDKRPPEKREISFPAALFLRLEEKAKAIDGSISDVVVQGMSFVLDIEAEQQASGNRRGRKPKDKEEIRKVA